MALQEEVPTFTESHFDRRHPNEASTRLDDDEKKVQARGKSLSKERNSPPRTIDRWRTSAEIQSHRPLWFRVMDAPFAGCSQKRDLGNCSQLHMDSLHVRALQKRRKRVDSTRHRGKPLRRLLGNEDDVEPVLRNGSLDEHAQSKCGTTSVDLQKSAQAD